MTPTAKKAVAKKKRQKQQKEISALESLGITPKWSTFSELKSYRSEADGKTRLSFDQMCELRMKLKDEIEFRKSRMEKIDEDLQVALAMAGTEKVEWEGRPVQVVTSRSASKIVAEKLLQLGVEADTVAEATVAGSEYSYVLFGKPKG